MKWLENRVLQLALHLFFQRLADGFQRDTLDHVGEEAADDEHLGAAAGMPRDCM